MRKIFVFGFLIIFIFQNIYASKLDEIRNLFPYFTSYEEVDGFLQSIECETSDLATVYKGALNMYKSKFVEAKLDKYKYFKKGKTLINKACENNPNSLEIRYIRLVFQHQLPSFLGYNEHKKEDFDFFIKQFSKSTLALEYKKKMVKNLLQLDYLSANQKQQLNNLI